MKTRRLAPLAAVVALSLSSWAIAQEQSPSGGEERSTSGQDSSGRAAQDTGDADKGAGSSDRSGTPDRSGQPSSQRSGSDRGPQDRSDASDSRDSALNRSGSRRDASDSSGRRTTNRVDARGDDDDLPDAPAGDDGRGGRDRGARTGDLFDRDQPSRTDRQGREDRATRDDDQGRDDQSSGRDRRDDDRSGRDDDDGDRDIDLGVRFSTNASNRLVVRDLQSRGIFGRAGLRDDDVIISVDGHRITTGPHLHRILLAADGRVPVIILRDGVQQTIYIDEVHLQTRNRATYDYDDELYQSDRAWLGVFIDTRYDNAVVVQAVQEGSAADDAGIRAGDRILSLNGRRVQTPSQLSQIIGSMEPGDRVEIDVARWQTRQVDAQLGERPATSSRFRYLDEGDVRETQPDGDDDRGVFRGGADFDARIRVQP